MSNELADLLDIRTAWKRVRSDFRHRAFLTRPHELALVESDLDSWLASVEQRVREDRYHPGAMLICEVPKGGGLIRPGNYLSLIDRVVYTACVGACLEQIHATLEWSQGEVDFAYRLARQTSDAAWIQSQFTGWQDFRKETLTNLTTLDAPYVVFADIAAFYETVDVGMLASDLRVISAPNVAVQQISTCLNRWAQSPARGLPQGVSASDILAKLYLNTIDVNLKVGGWRHVRYVDDLRVFCDDLVDAKKALLYLVQLLRHRGLHVQSAKTSIRTKAEAQQEVEGTIRTVTKVGRELVERLRAVYGDSSPYVSIPEIDRALSENPDQAPVQVLHEAYNEFFVDPEAPNFDATLFRFVLNRLAKAQDGYPCLFNFLEFLQSQPQETQTVLDFIRDVNCAAEKEDGIVAFLESANSIYPYQTFQVLHWLDDSLESPSERTIAFARRAAFDSAQPSYVRALGQKILGDHGTAADLERLEALYADLSSPMEQSELICCLYRVEVTRRNAFLARAEGDGELQRRAVRLVRTGAVAQRKQRQDRERQRRATATKAS
jgi:hypothetical protein